MSRVRQSCVTLSALLLPLLLFVSGCRSANGGVVHLRKSQHEEDVRRNGQAQAAPAKAANSGPTVYFNGGASMRNESSWCRLRNTHFASGSAFVDPLRENLDKSGYNVTSSRERYDVEARLTGVLRDCSHGNEVDGDLTLEIIRDDAVVERITKKVGKQNEWELVESLVKEMKGSPRVASALKGRVVALAPVQAAPVAASAPAVKTQTYVDNSPMVVANATSVLVVPLKCVRGVPKDTCPLITNYMMSQFQSVKNLRTVGQDDINAVLGVDKQKQAIGCGDVSCMAEIGGALGVDLVMYGELGVLGTKYNINVSAVRTSNASVAARASLRCDKTEDALADNLPTLVRDVVNGINTATPVSAAQ